MAIFKHCSIPIANTTPLRRHIPADTYADHLCAYAHTVLWQIWLYTLNCGGNCHA